MQNKYKYNREGYLNEKFRMFHLRDSVGQEKDFHFHEFDKIVILISGSVRYVVEGKEYALKPWDVLLVRNHMIHKALIDMSEPYERIIIYLDSSYVERFAPDGGLMDCFAKAERRSYCLIRPQGAETAAVRACLERMEASANDSGFGSDFLRGTMLCQLLVYLNRIMQHEAKFEPAASEYDDKIASALSYINENLSEKLSVDELAAKSFLSRYHFMRLFKSQTGYTVHNYVRQKRLALAARLMREGMSAQSAASECGFSDYSAFHKAFVKTFGISPGKIKSREDI